MKIVPIVFAFDNNLILPACVCISSLMMNAKEDTFYDIFILHSERVNLEKEQLDKIPSYYTNCRIQYRLVDDTFDSSYEIRGITTAAYYRLLIPELIIEYDKLIYSDVDIIFRMDLSELFSINIEPYYLAASHDFGLNIDECGKKYISSIGVEQGKYLQSGFLIFNTRRMRESHVVDRFRQQAQRKFRFQDQDILNIVCKGKIYYLSPKYNMTNYNFMYASRKGDLIKVLSNDDIKSCLRSGNIHYNGQKPWKGYCINFDIWWEYYRKSPFFNEKFYFDFFNNKLDELDKLTLWKRIKILIRYFIYGKK